MQSYIFLIKMSPNRWKLNSTQIIESINNLCNWDTLRRNVAFNQNFLKTSGVVSSSFVLNKHGTGFLICQVYYGVCVCYVRISTIIRGRVTEREAKLRAASRDLQHEMYLDARPYDPLVTCSSILTLEFGFFAIRPLSGFSSHRRSRYKQI